MIAALVFAVWSAHVNAAHTSVDFRTVYRARTERGTWNDERGESYSFAALSNRFRGLSADRFLAVPARVHFAEVHDSGTMDYTGTAGDGNASGEFSVIPNPQFATALERGGIGMPTADEARELVLMGADFAYLDVLAKQGFERPTVEQFLRLLSHGVSSEYLRDMAALRLTPHSIDTIVRARDHGVTPEYARGFTAAGLPGLSIEQLVRLRDHGVSAEYVSGLRKRGYTAQVTVEELIRLRDHGI